MSLFGRSSVTLAIIFGCFVVLIPRILLPYFRPRSVQVYRTDDHFRRSSPAPSLINHPQENTIEPIIDSSESSPDFVPADAFLSKPSSTFVLPMYVVGIAVFIIYTCFKYFGNRESQEKKIRSRYSPTNIQWNSQKNKFNYQMNNRQTMDDEQQEEEDSYAGLDADYVEYLKERRREECEREQALTTEQRQMHDTLDEMKHSFSFINSKLGSNTSNMSLTNNEITQLQNRLAQTEAQMYKILNALDVASNKMHEITQNTRTSLEEPRQRLDYDDDYHQSSKSLSESEEEEDDDEEEENSLYDEKQVSCNENNQKQDEDDESESSYEEDEVSHEYEDDESESSSDRYGLMTTSYGCEPSTIDDYDLDEIAKPEETTDSQTKVQEWRQRHHSQSLSSNHSSVGDNDQAIPTVEVEENGLRQRKHQHDE